MTEKWLIAPGEERVIDIASATRLKVGLVGGQVDVIAHDEPGIRIEVHGVTTKDLRIESRDGNGQLPAELGRIEAMVLQSAHPAANGKILE